MKKLIYGTLIFVLCGVAFVSCKKENKVQPTLNDSPLQSSERGAVSEEGGTILGEKLVNPFTTENMLLAYNALGGSPNLIATNQLYVRFKISEPSQAKDLEDRGVILSTIPFDYEVLEYGTFYNDPSLTNQIWMYATVAPNFDFSGFQHEVLANLFLPNLTVGTSEYSTIFSSFDHEALVDKALVLAGYEEEVQEKSLATKYRPKGYIRVQQKIGSAAITNVPVKNLKVRTKWWFDIGTGFTDDNGYFQSNEQYRKNRKVSVICIFENQNINIRAVKGTQFWDIFFTERKEIGEFQNSAMESINYVFNNSSNLSSDTKRKWMACHAINAIREQHVFCSQNGVTSPPNNLNMWLTNANANGNSLSTYAAAPMLKQMANNSYLVTGVQIFLVSTGNPWYAVAMQVLQQFPPDVTYNYSQNILYYTDSDQIVNFLYHEFSHASHYNKVGNAYWASYIGYIIQNNGYGSSTSSGSGRIAVSEAWAEFCSARFAHLKYGASTSIGQTWIEFIEQFKPFAGTNNWQWIPEGLMHDFTDVGEPTLTGVTDNVSGFSISQCFNAMDNDITSVVGYKNRFISENPSVSLTPFNTLFNGYGY